MANAAEAMNEEHKELVKAEMDQLFAEVGATNVNTYLHALTGIKPSSLNKESIPEYIAGLKDKPTEIQEKAKYMLTLRSEVMKTSNAKYTAIKNCIGDGGRIRGLFRYYGANRTGRWAGRLVQLQNLPQNHIEDLDVARDTAKMGDLALLGLVIHKP